MAVVRHRRWVRACLLCAWVAPAGVVHAQGAAQIVVTARRLEERPLEVPLAVETVLPGAIGAGGVDGLLALSARVPGLSFESIWGGANSFPVMRGLNQPSIAGDSVGMFVDGVYQANRDAIDVEPLDLERIEVVHGPQSALFGQSSFAGLIHYVPAGPTETLAMNAAADWGSGDLRGIRGALSGPLGGVFKGRLAASWKEADGTHGNVAEPGQKLGKTKRLALAATVATRDGSGPISARLSARYGDSRTNQPPFFSLDYRNYNCGGRDPTSGVWSYFCGAAPLARDVAVSPGLPDSRTRSGQVAVHLAYAGAKVELRSDSSFYLAEANSIRDFDGGAGGELFGVCVLGVTCASPASAGSSVLRLQAVNTVQRRKVSAREFAQEFRVRSLGEGLFQWQLGVAASWRRSRTLFGYGAERGALAANQRLSSLVLANPLNIGPLAAMNLALVDDPATAQVTQNDAIEIRRSISVFATADYRIDPDWRLRGEIRVRWERLALDSRSFNFLPSFGKTLGARHFRDVTPRVSVDWRPAQRMLAYLSYARGSRSGGLNSAAGLLPEEQAFAPETNWTGELGLKYIDTGLVRSLQATAYQVDWRNTQIIGLATTPGVTALIQRNTRGIRSYGVELVAQLAPAPWLQLDLAYSYTHPRFKAGSEDPGSIGACGLTAGSSLSSFCVIRPSRINPGQLVPDISGKLPSRAVPVSWSAGVTLAPPGEGWHGLSLHAGLAHQGNGYDRQVNGLKFGARTLLDARLSLPLGSCSIELWGANLLERHYIRAGAGRPPAFYTGQPRPTDLILGEGRRIGLTLRVSQ